MPEKLPNGWVKTTLGEIATLSRERASPMDDPEMRYIGLEHIEPQSMKLKGHGYAREIRSSSVRFFKGDVLYGKMRPYLNKVWVAEFDGLCSAELLVFKQQDGLNSQFLGTRLNAEDFVSFANGQVSGERPRVDFEKLSHFNILLPPRAEQERIVAKLNAAFSSMGRAQTAAHRAQERLKRYRAAVLHSAATGQLTRAWRDAYWQNKKYKVETGEVLLQRLLATRRRHWEKSELDHLRFAGIKPKDDRWKSRYPEPTPISTGDLPKLPELWTWASIGQLTSLVTSGSRGWKAYYSTDGAIFIRSQDIRTDKLDLDEVAHVRPPRASEGRRTQIKRGDLLVTITGANVGKAAVVEVKLTEAYVSQHVALLRFVDTHLVLLAHIYITSPEDGRKRLLASAYGAGKPGLNLENLRELSIPLPPLAEQTEIVGEVERRMLAADQLDAALEQQLMRARATRQSLLREAFNGRLVPQNPNDEPASFLLKHIHAARERDAKSPRGKRMSKSKSKSNAIQRPLLDTLREHRKPMTPEQLFRDSGYQQLFEDNECRQEIVDKFYEELRQQVGPKGPILEKRPSRNTVLLEIKS